jgi:hypothetical protein
VSAIGFVKCTCGRCRRVTCDRLLFGRDRGINCNRLARLRSNHLDVSFDVSVGGSCAVDAKSNAVSHADHIFVDDPPDELLLLVVVVFVLMLAGSKVPGDILRLARRERRK